MQTSKQTFAEKVDIPNYNRFSALVNQGEVNVEGIDKELGIYAHLEVEEIGSSSQESESVVATQVNDDGEAQVQKTVHEKLYWAWNAKFAEWFLETEFVYCFPGMKHFAPPSFPTEILRDYAQEYMPASEPTPDEARPSTKSEKKKKKRRIIYPSSQLGDDR
ncbi:hypothetical protein TSUD_329300 [Trifolium subterraneum]|uniref:Uncharacterized protein n=1 Tax=Trifolium subterraneum TaxID=3900 RepID=A0A2Z6NRW6_TRISU|nr:hypothetical protein TSUD_329300 [Trifolium subterraneum]